MLLNYIKNKFYQIALAEKSVEKLTLSFCLGNLIAWSPIIPLQTPLIFILAWLFGLNATVTFISVYLINNPITLLPIYVIDYFFGVWLFDSVLKLNLIHYNPSWMDKFNSYIGQYIDFKKYTGEGAFCFWCLILGGIILGFIISLIMYPIMKHVFKKLIEKIEKSKSK